jgi:hypothetical protein
VFFYPSRRRGDVTCFCFCALGVPVDHLFIRITIITKDRLGDGPVAIYRIGILILVREMIELDIK